MNTFLPDISSDELEHIETFSIGMREKSASAKNKKKDTFFFCILAQIKEREIDLLNGSLLHNICHQSELYFLLFCVYENILVSFDHLLNRNNKR